MLKVIKNIVIVCGIMLAWQGALVAEQTVMAQGFEDTDFFGRLSANGYTMASSAGGKWGVFGSDKAVSISDEQAAVGKYSLKITRMDKSQTNAIGAIGTALSAETSISLEIWIYRPDLSDFSVALGGIDQATGRTVNVAALVAGENGKLMIRNATDDKWQRTSLKMPDELWVPVFIAIDRAAKKIVFKIELNGKTEIIGIRELTGPAVAIDRLLMGAAPCPPGSSIYFDEVKITSITQ